MTATLAANAETAYGSRLNENETESSTSVRRRKRGQTADKIRNRKLLIKVIKTWKTRSRAFLHNVEVYGPEKAKDIARSMTSKQRKR